MTFGQTVVGLRKARSFSQRTLAAKMKRDTAYLSRIENDVYSFRPSSFTIINIAKALSLSEAETDALYAKAGRIPLDVTKILIDRPESFAEIRSRAKSKK